MSFRLWRGGKECGLRVDQDLTNPELTRSPHSAARELSDDHDRRIRQVAMVRDQPCSRASQCVKHDPRASDAPDV